MHLWQFCGVISILFIIFEMLTPSMFFLNFALAALICMPVSVYVKNPYALIIIFFILSFASFVFLRPMLIRKISKETETGLSSKYIGKVLKAETDISVTSGVINIYGERWEARSESGEVIPAGCDIKIVRNESLIMYVENLSK